MLQRINNIRNVGVFKDFSLDQSRHGEIEFSKINLIYGKNGSGKSTLVEIMKSLANNDIGRIEGRRTIGGVNKQNIELLINNKTYIFDGKWNKSYPEIAIFDQEYINENIHLGQVINTNNRRNQFNLMVGKDNISINLDLNDVNKKIRDLRKEKKAFEIDLKSKISGDFTLENFINLNTKIDMETIERKLETLLKERDNYNQKFRVNNLNLLKKLEIQDFDLIDFSNFLNSNSDNLLTNTEMDIKSHIDKYSVDISWLENGLNGVLDNTCPFCTQPLDKSEIFQTYKDYFNKNFKEYDYKVKNFAETINSHFSEIKALEHNISLERNQNLYSEIQQHLNIENSYQFINNQIGDKIISLYNSINLLMDKKLENPFNSLNADLNIDNLNREYMEVFKIIENYNLEIDIINDRVNRYKDKLSTIDIKLIESEIDYYKNLKTSKEKQTKENISFYNELNNKLTNLENKKTLLKKRLSQANNINIQKFNDLLNHILFQLNVPFKVDYLYPKFNAYGVEANYNLIIRNKRLKSRVTKKESVKTPNFKNTLSGGEKNLLAFAYFITSIKMDNFQEKKIIFFDDPTNYSDKSNKVLIAEQIFKLFHENNQIFILTHDIEFSKAVWKFNLYNDVTGLYIVANDESSEIITRDVYRKRIM